MSDRGAMKIGVQLPEVERDVRWAEVRAMALLAEDVGFDSLWVGDHLLYRTPEGTPRGPWEAWSQLAALAAATTRVELGPLVAATSFHAPAMIAKKAATIDEISGGRLILGLGAGWHETEYRAFGFPFDHRVSRFEEAFTIIRTLLREGEIDFDGRFYQARDCALRPRGPRAAGPPIMVGSIGERMLAITAPHVDLWNAWYDWFDNSPARFAGGRRRGRDGRNGGGPSSRLDRPDGRGLRTAGGGRGSRPDDPRSAAHSRDRGLERRDRVGPGRIRGRRRVASAAGRRPDRRTRDRIARHRRSSGRGRWSRRGRRGGVGGVGSAGWYGVGALRLRLRPRRPGRRASACLPAQGRRHAERRLDRQDVVGVQPDEPAIAIDEAAKRRVHRGQSPRRRAGSRARSSGRRGAGGRR